MSGEPPAGSPGFQASLQRGALLRQQGRYPEAEGYLQEAIAQQPSVALGYFELALCYCNWKGHDKQALSTIERAVALLPTEAEFFGLRAWILVNLDKERDALVVAEQALTLNPHNLLALNAQTRAYIGLSEWKQAEATTRRTLALNAHNEMAANYLALALRQQGRLEESEAVSAGLLARAPDNATAQTNAGWSALQAGDYRRANQHFLEALRLDPNYNYARVGLLHAFNSRVWIYRVYFQLVAWLGTYKKGMRYFLLFLIYVGYRAVITTLRVEYGSASTYWVLVLVALYFIIFGFGRSFGNFFLLLDPFARHALKPKEKWLSLLVAFGYSCLLGAEILGGAWLQTAILLVIPGCFVWGALSLRFQDARSKHGADVNPGP